MPTSTQLGPVLVGLGAGLASALLFASASTGTVIGIFFLFALSPLPIVIAGLGWGWGAAGLAAALAAASIGIVETGRAAVFHLAAFGVPATVGTWLALLSRTVPSSGSQSATLEWYPLGRIVGWAALWAGLLTALALLATGPDVESLRESLAKAFDKILVIEDETPPEVRGGAGQSGNQGANQGSASESRPVPSPDPTGKPQQSTVEKQAKPDIPAGRPTQLGAADKRAFVDLMVIMLPWAIATCWMTLATLNLWMGAHVVRMSGRLMRPWPDLSSLTLPRLMPLAFAVAVALTFVPEMPGLLASGTASAILFAYLLAGLAIVHFVTRGKPARPLLLSAVYGSLLLLSPFSSLAVAMIGLAEPVSPLRRSPPQPPRSGPGTGSPPGV